MSFLQLAKAMSGSAESAISAVTPIDPARRQPLAVDEELALRLGLEGSRREFLQAVDLVAELAGRPRWREQEALRAIAIWWGMPPEKLESAQWVLSAARADEIMGCPRPRAGERG